MRELVFRLEPGVDLRQWVEAECRVRFPAGGFVLCGIGSLIHPVLRLAGANEETRYAGPFEILTLAGSVTPQGAHLHASIASARGQVFGGHVPYGNQVRTTAELLIVSGESWRMTRRYDAVTGFAELAVKTDGAA